jgi:hypothetical protein
MRISKALMTGFVVVMIAAFTFTMVGAQEEPTTAFPVSGNGDIQDISTFTPLPDDYEPSAGDVTPLATSPYPISPNGNSIFTKTPRFYFTRNLSATKYRVWVYDIVAAKTVYVYKGAGVCGTAYCYLEPPTSLKPYKYGATEGGLYIWAVDAKVGLGWVGYSSFVEFVVFSSGFTSTFDVNAKKWLTLNGTWGLTSKGYYRTYGTSGQTVNILQNEYFLDGIVYEVKMKRKANNLNWNRIYLAGDPYPFFDTQWWYAGYMLEFKNDGSWAVIRNSSGVYTQLAYVTGSPTIEPYGWNTLTVWMDHGTLHFWINGMYLGYYNDTALTGGFVGIGMFKSTTEPDPLLVDYAKVYYSGNAPYSVALTATGELDPATEMNGTTIVEPEGMDYTQ